MTWCNKIIVYGQLSPICPVQSSKLDHHDTKWTIKISKLSNTKFNSYKSENDGPKQQARMKIDIIWLSYIIFIKQQMQHTALYQWCALASAFWWDLALAWNK